MNHTPAGGEATGGVGAQEVDAVMVATRVLVAVSAQSVASVEDHITLPQLRVLVMIASRGTQNVTSVAQGLGVHASNATRTCDKLVEAGLLHRSEDPADRRNLLLELTQSGIQLVHTVTEHRRAAIESILARMSARGRSNLVPPYWPSPKQLEKSHQAEHGPWAGRQNNPKRTTGGGVPA